MRNCPKLIFCFFKADDALSQPEDCNSSAGRKLFESLDQVKVEALEEFMVMRASSGQQFLGGHFCAPCFERVLSRTCLGDLILDPGLLGLEEMAVFAS